MLALIAEFNQAFNCHDADAMMRLMTEDCVFENTFPAPDGNRFSGKESVHAFWVSFFQSSPQARIEIEESFEMGDRLVQRWVYHWVDEAGSRGHVRGVDIFKIQEGLILEKLSYVKG
jgi:uncharacterized protein (TIGR02246 family)